MRKRRKSYSFPRGHARKGNCNSFGAGRGTWKNRNPTAHRERVARWVRRITWAVFAKAGLWLLKSTFPADMPRLIDVHLDWRVLVFAGALTILTGFFFGLAPALHSSRIVPAESLKSGGRGAAISVSQRLRSTLVVAEVAFAVMLVLSAGLLIRSFWAISHPGFKYDHLVTGRITPNELFCKDAGRCLAFYRSGVPSSE
jgi:hypothetical protein